MPGTSAARAESLGSDGGESGKRLSNRTDRSGTTIHGWPAVSLGSVMAVLGGSVGILGSLGKLNAAPGVPPWIGLVVAAIFAVAGLSFVIHGLMGLRRQRRARRLRPHYERKPWIWDHPWNETGIRDDTGRVIARAIWVSGFLALFFVVPNWIGFFTPARPWPFIVSAVICDLILVGVLSWLVYLVGRRMKYGVSALRFRRFPFRVGGEVEVALQRTAQLASLGVLDATLRCVQERYVTTGTGENRSTSVVCYELWAATCHSEPPAPASRTRREWSQGPNELGWRFSVPAGLPGTSLTARPARYWELEVKAVTPGIDYGATFLVPVY